MSRLKLYVAASRSPGMGSAVMANVVLLRAYYERPNFYSAAVYIAQSTGSLMFLVNLMLIVAASCGFALQRLFYGPLRPIETEQLYDKAWFAVSETLLAMTIFRDDIGIWFFTMFLCLLAGKVWQWIGEGRVEFLEQQPPANPKLFHTRLTSSLLLSVAFDIFMMQYCVNSILSDSRPGVMVMFGFEYVLLAIASISTLLRYALSLVELAITHRQEKAREEARRTAQEQATQRAATEGARVIAPEEDDNDDDNGDVPGWEEKGRWVFYLDLATDFIKSVVYLGFFMILMTFYGIPIHIMRDLFMTIRSFIKRLHDFVQYRNATRDMNTRYPDATAEDLARENTCIVCREEMRPWSQPDANGAQPGRRQDERQRAKKLPCGHILHFSCLRSWLERQQVCPTCRRSVLVQASAQGTRPNDAAGQNQLNQQVQNNYLQAFLQRNAAPGAAEPAGAQGQPPQPVPEARQNQPQGNLRVFNLGPFRIAMGNLRIPAEQQANPNNVREAVNQLRQQAAGNNHPSHPTSHAPPETQTSHVAQTQGSTIPVGRIPGAVALHPSDIQSDILRIQHNIIESLRELNAQHEQLEIVHRLLGELSRIQQSFGGSLATGQELPHIAPLHSQALNPFTPQAYLARGPVLRQGDDGVPTGLTLPDGWTLRPMALSPRVGQDSRPMPMPAQSPQLSETWMPFRSVPPIVSHTSLSASSVQETATSSSTSPDVLASGQQTNSEPRRTTEAEPLGSTWSLGDMSGETGAGNVNSTVNTASGPVDAQSTMREATVEDAEESER
ncbi:E3 ubiquitin-protein ligase hrd1 [Pleosporales sp. CAS-2024a]